MCRAAKFVSPIGLNHAVDGGTNCARLPSNASSKRLSGTRRSPSVVSPVVITSRPSFPDCSGEACEHFDSLIGIEAKEEGVILVPDLTEEALEPSPAAIPLGAGLDGKG
jgi:hypothetical protein